MRKLLVGTRKGLFVFEPQEDGSLRASPRKFEGQVVEYAMGDARSGYYFAAVTHGQFGPHLYRTRDPEGEWEEMEGPTFPEEAEGTLERIWVLVPGVEEGVLWAGVAPAALFCSRDDGRSWQLNRALWDHPTRPHWQGGMGGLCLHSICPWPGDPKRLAVGISAAGVWLTQDGGASWRRGIQGLVPRYIPEEARADTLDYCVHNMHRCPTQPSTLYMQFHGGVYRSDDGGASWQDVGADSGLPSDFGFPLVVHPTDPDRAFVIPLAADLDRVAPEGRLRVFETRDRGGSWQETGAGLPQEGAWVNVLRQAFCCGDSNPLELYFGTQSGELFGWREGDGRWRSLARHLPPILSVRCA